MQNRQKELRLIKEKYRQLILSYQSDRKYDAKINKEFRKVYAQYVALNVKANDNIDSANDPLRFSASAVAYFSQLPFEFVEYYLKMLPHDLHDEFHVNRQAFLKSVTHYSQDEIRKINEYYSQMTADKVNEIIMLGIKKYKNSLERVQDRAYLWLATKPGNTPIYIFGTVHQMTESVDDIFGEVVKNLIDKVDHVFFEVKLRPQDFEMYKVNGYRYSSMDLVIAREATVANKKLFPLENEKTRVICHQNAHESVDSSPPQHPEHVRLQAMLMTRMYLDDPAVTNFVPTRWPRQIAVRNIFWMHSILNLTFRPSLIVSGLRHCAGKYGLPNLLAAEGYQLTPLMKKIPTRKSQLVHEFAFGNVIMNSIFRPISSNKEKKQNLICSNRTLNMP